jgi:hypothetical protein
VKSKSVLYWGLWLKHLFKHPSANEIPFGGISSELFNSYLMEKQPSGEEN